MRPFAARAHEPRNEPDRENDNRAEYEIAPHGVDRIPAEVPDLADQPLDARDQIPRIEAEGGQEHADHDRQQDQAYDHPKGRAAEETVDGIVGHVLPPSAARDLACPNGVGEA